MPVDLPVRKTLEPHAFFAPASDPMLLIAASLCIVVALAGLISHTPKTYRDALSATIYEDMLRAP